MATRRKVANLLALAVLAYLAKQPMHPYQLGRTLRDHDDARSIKYNQGSLYMVFEQLTRAGFIVARETSRAGQRPERTVYALTDAGRRELRDWLRELVEEPQHEYPQFVAALSLIGALPPGETVELLGRRLDRLTVQRAEVRGLIDGTLAAGVHPLFVIEEDYRLALLDAESVFVEQLIDRITDPETGWGPQWEEVHGQAATSHERPRA
jgi:DNA-binding PadR family transcriptional regulator